MFWWHRYKLFFKHDKPDDYKEYIKYISDIQDNKTYGFLRKNILNNELFGFVQVDIETPEKSKKVFWYVPYF